MENIIDQDCLSIINNMKKDYSNDELINILHEIYDQIEYYQCDDGILYCYFDKKIKLITDCKIFNMNDDSIMYDIFYNYFNNINNNTLIEYIDNNIEYYEDENGKIDYNNIKIHWKNTKNIKHMINTIINDNYNFSKNELNKLYEIVINEEFY